MMAKPSSYLLFLLLETSSPRSQLKHHLLGEGLCGGETAPRGDRRQTHEWAWASGGGSFLHPTPTPRRCDHNMFIRAHTSPLPLPPAPRWSLNRPLFSPGPACHFPDLWHSRTSTRDYSNPPSIPPPPHDYIICWHLPSSMGSHFTLQPPRTCLRCEFPLIDPINDHARVAGPCLPLIGVAFQSQGLTMVVQASSL